MLLLQFVQNVKCEVDMKEILNNEFTTISYDNICNSIIGTWKKPSTTEAYKLIFSEILESVSSFNADALIIDIYHQGIVGMENRKWLQNEILPKAYRQGLRKVAIVTPNDVFSTSYIDSIKKGTLALSLDFQAFNDLIMAKSWVLNEEISV